MGVFGRSWNITKLSFGVIKKDKEMLLFPLLAGIFSLLYALALLFPTVIVKFTRQASAGHPVSVTLAVLDYILIFITYVGLAFIATFFNVCVVYTARKRFEGGDATFMESFKFAISRLPRIFAWSLLAGTVGLLLHSLDSIAERVGGIGKVLISLLRGLLGGLWSIVTIFVVPAMVYQDLGPIDAIKCSIETLKRTWGESLIRHFGLGLIQFLFFLLGILLAIALFVVLTPLGSVGFIVALAITVVYFIGMILVFSLANMVFNTALFAYANGHTPAEFDEETLAGAFRIR